MKRFLLLSDIHACDIDPASSSSPSYVSSFNARASGKIDPLVELERLVRDQSLGPDYVLCAGDITNRSNPGALNFAWEKLNGLAQSCNAKLIATVGNHDLDSRFQANKFDPRGYVMSLYPSIPVAERIRYLEFWAENFTLISDQNCNILVLNTAAYHGGAEDVAREIEHGRVSDVTLEAIKAKLSVAPQAPVNILLCHHHPIKGDRSDSELIGLTRGGEKLVEVLDVATGPWVVVHGHKHVPDLFYGYGGSNAPVILGCASFSAQVNADAQNKNPNQVHLLVCDPDGANSSGLTSAGSVYSWTWQPGIGWRKSQDTHGLPHVAGFGYRGDVKVLRDRIEKHLEEQGVSHVLWQNAVTAIPLLRRLIPNDFQKLERVLKDAGLIILRDSDGSIHQVGRQT